MKFMQKAMKYNYNKSLQGKTLIIATKRLFQQTRNQNSGYN